MVPSSVTVEGDDWIANASVTCINTGTAKIFAMSDNLASASVTVSVITNTNPVASVKINVVASYLPADETRSTYLALQTVDSTGKPTRLTSSKVVTLFSSDAAVLDLDSITTIDTTSSVEYVKALPKLGGTTKITVGTANIGGSDVTVNVYSPQATTLTLIAPPIPADGDVTACLVALSSGVPAPLSQSTLIQLSSTDTQIADVDSSTILTAKNYYTTFSLSGRSPGQFSLTAIGSGLPSSSATLQVYEVRPSIFKVAYVKPLAQTGFPLVVQAVSSLSVPVVTDAAITVNLASSNTTVIAMQDAAVISAEDSNALTYGLAASEGSTTLTLSSGDFNALSVDVSAQAMVGGLTLASVDRYRAGGSIKVTATIIMDNSPVTGATITWSGKGLYAETSTTDSSGKSENIITLSEGVNLIEAKVDVPGLGQLTAQRRIVGVRQYTLEVASNIGTEIEGSGSYAEGAIQTISAPASIELAGILGILGVKQVFKQWTGISESTNSTVEVVFTGESKQLALLAEYETDYMGLILRIGLMTVVFVVVVVGLTLWRRRSE
jgi:hypothetical protein